MSNAWSILNNPFKNKGTAFTNEERKKLGLVGTLHSNTYDQAGPKLVTLQQEFIDVVGEYQEVLLRIRAYKSQNKTFEDELQLLGRKRNEELWDFVSDMKHAGYKYEDTLVDNFKARMSLWD